MDGAAATPAQVQTTLGNWYTVQLRRRRRLKKGYQRNGGQDERRTTNPGTQNRPKAEMQTESDHILRVQGSSRCVATYEACRPDR
jgi:hypothetical protein